MFLFQYERDQRKIKKLLKQYPEHAEWYFSQLEANQIEKEWKYFKNNLA
jgi:hypothetical protein